MDTCTPYFAPAMASIKVVYVNESMYSSYHYQGVQDCSGPRQHVIDLAVNQCENDGDSSQVRVWVMGPSPSAGSCAVPGDCGRAYQACCFGSEATGNPCACHLRNGTGTAGSTDCGKCGQAFVACCTAAGLAGSPCNCDVNSDSLFVI